MTPSSNNQEYKWTVKDVRELDTRLSKIEAAVNSGVDDIKEMKKELENNHHLVVDNTKQPNWGAISILIGSAVAAALAVWAQIKQ